jgi:hypothetical protein
MHKVLLLTCFRQENYTAHKCSATEKSRESQRQRKKAADNRDEESKNVSTCGKGGDENGSGEPFRKKKSTNTASKSGGLVCDVCGEVYKTMHILKAHMQLHGKCMNHLGCKIKLILLKIWYSFSSQGV